MPPPSACPGNFNGAGSTLQQSFDRAVLAAYPGSPPFAYNAPGFATGSGAGLNQLLAGQTLFAGSDVPPTAAQDAQAAAQNNSLLNFPVAFAATAVGANLPGFPPGFVLKLGAQVLANIYLGVVTMWNDTALVALNPALAGVNQKIQTVARSDASGDTANFTAYLAANVPGWPAALVGVGPFPFSGALLVKGNASVASTLQTIPFSLGYLALGFVPTGVLVAAIQNSSNNFVQASLAAIDAVSSSLTSVPADLRLNTINAPVPNGYPITNPTNLVVFAKEPSACIAANLKALLAFFAAAGQGLANASLLGTLPAVVVNQYLANLVQITSLTGF